MASQALVFLAPAVAIATGWAVFEAWLIASDNHLGHVIDIKRADNPHGPKSWSAHIKGWVQGVRFDKHVVLFERPPDTGPIPIRGRLVTGRPFVRVPGFPIQFISSAGFAGLAWFMLIVTLGQT